MVDSGFHGLAPFLRASIAGLDLRPQAQELLQRAQAAPEDAELWLTLAYVMMAMDMPEVGLSLQAQALQMRRTYTIPARQQPVRVRVLLLMAPGDLAANTPLECLLEDSDVELIFYYLAPETLFVEPLPLHDIAMVAMGEGAEHRWFLDQLSALMTDWPRPVINGPWRIPATDRETASALLRDAPGVDMPSTWRVRRDQLQAVQSGSVRLAELFAELDFPVILRPIGSQAGRDLDRLSDPAALAVYLARVADDGFFISRFVDYSGADGLFRKYRVVLIDGRPYACHMAVSAHWMVHYVNAGMYEEAAKRAEEARFMADFADFAARHQAALAAVHQRIGLDYLCLDCAQTAAGKLLIFETDHIMVVHAMDVVELFPYKATQIARVRDAFRDFLLRTMAAPG